MWLWIQSSSHRHCRSSNLRFKYISLKKTLKLLFFCCFFARIVVSGAEWTAPVKLNSLHLLICSNIHRRCCQSGSLCKIFSSNADYRRVVLLRLLRLSLCDGWTAFRVIGAPVKQALISLTSVLFAVRGGVSRSGMSFTKMLMQRKVGVTMRSSGNDTGRSRVDSE